MPCHQHIRVASTAKFCVKCGHSFKTAGFSIAKPKDSFEEMAQMQWSFTYPMFTLKEDCERLMERVATSYEFDLNKDLNFKHQPKAKKEVDKAIDKAVKDHGLDALIATNLKRNLHFSLCVEGHSTSLHESRGRLQEGLDSIIAQEAMYKERVAGWDDGLGKAITKAFKDALDYIKKAEEAAQKFVKGKEKVCEEIIIKYEEQKAKHTGKPMAYGLTPKEASSKRLAGKKQYYRKDGVGKAKYTVNFHDGKKTHKDGSDFYDIRIFKNKDDMEDFIADLKSKGYTEER